MLRSERPETGVNSVATDQPSGADTALALSPESADLLFREARTANTFTAEPVTDEQLQAIYELAKFGPTALNAQPLRVTLLRSEAAKDRLIPLLAPANREKTGSAPVVALLSYDIDFHEQLPTVFPHMPQARDSFASSAERRAEFARNNAWLQAGYFIMAIRAAGLAAGPMGGFDVPGVDAEFFPDSTQRAIMVVNIGQPGEHAWQDRLPRLTFDQAVEII
ncbi:MAG: malonic semialdehyde reductase [Candidatus Nanopelagicales bacterium]